MIKTLAMSPQEDLDTGVLPTIDEEQEILPELSFATMMIAMTIANMKKMQMKIS